MENICLEELKRKVADKSNKMKLVHIVWMCLKFVELHPEAISDIGIFWIDGKNFLLNSIIFCEFINQKPNTINRNFRNHGFGCEKTKFSMRAQILEKYPGIYLPDPKNWTVRYCKGFTRETTENEAKNWKCNEIICKPLKEKHINQSKIKNNIDDINFSENIIYSNNLCVNNNDNCNNNDIISNNTYNFSTKIKSDIIESIDTNDNLSHKNIDTNITSNQIQFHQSDGENEFYNVLENLEVNNCRNDNYRLCNIMNNDVDYYNNDAFQQFEKDFIYNCDIFRALNND